MKRVNYTFLVNRCKLLQHPTLSNAVEASEKRKDAQLLREYELALPHELELESHIELVRKMAQTIVDEFELVVGWAIHAPRRISDDRNQTAFLLITTRGLEDGIFGKKIREMSVRPSSQMILTRHRKLWATIQNTAMEQAGRSDRVDERTLKEQRKTALNDGDIEGANLLDREPGKKLHRIKFTEKRRAEKRLKVGWRKVIA